MALNPDEGFMSGQLSAVAATLDETCAKATSLQLAGELDLAAQMYRAILRADPQHAAANHCLGLLHVQSRRPSEGLPHLIAALAADPQVADYWLGYLEALVLTGQTMEAQSTLALGRQHGLQGRSVEEFAARLSVKLLPLPEQAPVPVPVPARRRGASVAAHKLEAQIMAQVKAGKFAAAQSSARALTAGFPDRGLGWKALGALLAAEGKTDEAVSAMQQAVRLLPRDAEALRNLGVTLGKLKRFKEAAPFLEQAIAIDPNLDDLHAHLGYAYISLEKYPQAEAMYRQAVAACGCGNDAPNDTSHSSLLFLLSHKPELSAAELFAEHVAAGRWIEGPSGPVQPNFSNEREPERRLKLGFVSADFRFHALANFFEPLLEQLRDREDLELYAYYNHKDEDDTTRRLRSHFAHWHSVSALSDREMVNLIQGHRMDVLIDLSSHTSFNRLRAFALKPAPVQVSWLGYPGTTGLQAMDYYLADRLFLPPGQFDGSFTEKIAYLPASSSFQPYPDSPPVNGLPAIEAGFVTFGSFNRLGKLNPFTIRLWCRLLREVPDSIMLVGAMPLDERQEELTQLFNAEGVASKRLAFFPRADMPTYLALHNRIDICLDSFPYTGGTTTNHALWMGVPTLTLAGQTPASRQGAAIMASLGLQGFVAENPDDFVRKGLLRSSELGALAAVRSSLRERLLTSPLHRPEIVAAAFEAAVRHMWRRWCAGLPAESFHSAPEKCPPGTGMLHAPPQHGVNKP